MNEGKNQPPSESTDNSPDKATKKPSSEELRLRNIETLKPPIILEKDGKIRELNHPAQSSEKENSKTSFISQIFGKIGFPKTESASIKPTEAKQGSHEGQKPVEPEVVPETLPGEPHKKQTTNQEPKEKEKIQKENKMPEISETEEKTPEEKKAEEPAETKPEEISKTEEKTPEETKEEPKKEPKKEPNENKPEENPRTKEEPKKISKEEKPEAKPEREKSEPAGETTGKTDEKPAEQKKPDEKTEEPPQKPKKPEKPKYSNRIFVVHGGDERMKNKVVPVIKKLKFEAEIFHNGANEKNNIHKRFSQNQDIGFAIVLLSIEDFAYGKDQKPQDAKVRPSQRVIFELGFLSGKLGQSRIFVLYPKKSNFELPTEFFDVYYTPFDDEGRWKNMLRDRMKTVEYEISDRIII